MRFCAFLSICVLLAVNNAWGQSEGLRDKRTARWARQDKFQALSREDGGYLLFGGGFRIQPEPDKIPSSYSNWSGSYGIRYGYQKSKLSYEVGLSLIYHSPNPRVQIPELEHSLLINHSVNSIVVPVAIRYTIPVGERENFRFGANFTANWIAIALNGYNNSSGGGSYDWRGNVPPSDRLVYTWETDEKKARFFFQAGIHGEVQVFKSSFLMVQVSRAFSFGPAVTYNYQWTGKGQSGDFQVESSIEGFIFEIAYRLPLQVLVTKLRRKESGPNY